MVIIAKCLLPDGAYQLLLNWKAHIHNSKVGCFLGLIILERSQVPLELIKLFHFMMSYISVSVDSLICFNVQLVMMHFITQQYLRYLGYHYLHIFVSR